MNWIEIVTILSIFVPMLVVFSYMAITAWKDDGTKLINNLKKNLAI